MISSVVALTIFTSIFSMYKIHDGAFQKYCRVQNASRSVHEPHRTISFLTFFFIEFHVHTCLWFEA